MPLNLRCQIGTSRLRKYGGQTRSATGGPRTGIRIGFSSQAAEKDICRTRIPHFHHNSPVKSDPARNTDEQLYPTQNEVLIRGRNVGWEKVLARSMTPHPAFHPDFIGISLWVGYMLKCEALGGGKFAKI